MARLHSKRKGKAGTKRPKSRTGPKWASAKPAEVSELVLRMAREGVPQARIGLRLRDEHAVPDARAALGMSMSAFLKKENATPEYPDDLLSLIRTAVRVRNHMKTNKKDVHGKVKLMHIESKIHRLVKYYTRSGRLPAGWKYDAEKVALLVK